MSVIQLAGKATCSEVSAIDWNTMVKSWSSSFVIWREGSNYYRRSSVTGQINWGNNATTIIQGAIDALDAIGGGVIFIREGTYVIPSTITVKDNICLAGVHRDVVILNSTITDGSPVIKTSGVDMVDACDWCSAKDFTIIGNGAEGDGVEWIFAPQTILTNIRVEDVGGSGIHIHHCWGGKAINLYTNNCHDGIELEDRNHSFDLISSCANNSTRYSLWIHEGTDNLGAGTNICVSGGFYQNGGTSDVFVDDARGINFISVYQEGSGDKNYWEFTDTSTAVNITGCYITGSGSGAAHLIELTSAYHVRITGCRLAGFTGNEIAINYVGGNYISVIDNRYENVAAEFQGGPPADFHHRKFAHFQYEVNMSNEDLVGVYRIYTSGATALQIYTNNVQRFYVGVGSPAVIHCGNVADDTVFRLPLWSADPATGGWGANEVGRMWYRTDTDKIRYWDGAAVQELSTEPDV